MTLGGQLFLAGAGLLGGAVNSVAGGGSLIVFPAFVATGYGTLPANVTNAVAQWPGYVGGVVGFRPELRGQRDRAGRLGAAAVAGAALGAAVLLAAPPGAFDLVVPFLVLLARLLLAFQRRLATLVGPPRADRADRANQPANQPAGQAADHGADQASGPDQSAGSTTDTVPAPPRRAAYPAMFLAGAYGGYFGGALGVILIGVLALTVRDTLRRVNALKTALSLLVGTVPLVAFGLFGPVNWAGVAVVAPSTLVGGFLGARVARRINDRVLRACVVTFGVAVAALLYLRR